MNNYKACVYMRLSKEDNKENNSIEAQKAIAFKYAEEHQITIVKEYVDNGYSGMLDSRPAFNEMIIDILNRKVNMVIVKDLSRLTRDKNKTGQKREIGSGKISGGKDQIDSAEKLPTLISPEPGGGFI